MKKSNKIVAIVATAIMVASLGIMTGCSATSTVTTTSTTTTTDADGHTVTSTVETVNGETHESVVFENIPMDIQNNLGGDIADMLIKMSDAEEWSDDFIAEEDVIEDGSTASGLTVTYSSDSHNIDVLVRDLSGNELEFDAVELPVNNGENMTLILEYNADDDSFSAYVM